MMEPEPAWAKVIRLKREIREHNEAREMAVGYQDFEAACHHRDEAHRLRAELERAILESRS